MDSLDRNGWTVCVGISGQFAPEYALYLIKYGEDRYKEHFPYVDNAMEVRDPQRQKELDDLLLAHIREGDTEKIWLAVPEIIDWADYEGFSYRTARSAELHLDLFLEAYISEKGPATNFTIERLKRDSIYGVESIGGIPIRKWSPYRCMNAEIITEDGSFCLSNGIWYQIDPSFLETINNYYSQIPQDQLTLPNYHHDNEDSYNNDVADIQNIALMHNKKISFDGSRSSIEFCDLYTKDSQMVHVKRYQGSGPLSHLFNQGLVSAASFLYEVDFRKKLNLKLPSAFQLKDPLPRPEARKYEVVYAIISASDRSLDLPFFSKVSLRNVCRELVRLGFVFSLTKIKSDV